MLKKSFRKYTKSKSCKLKKINYDISRYIKVLTFSEQKLILNDLRNPYKIEHWMWYGLPQPRFSPCSELSKFYAIEVNEVIPFIQNKKIRPYYIKALRILCNKKPFNNDSFLKYFSIIDYKKFINHITFFYNTIGTCDKVIHKYLLKLYKVLNKN